jgi:hypothetical protein
LDQVAPVVTLNGLAELTIAHGGSYTESGATASGATSSTPTITGSVNPNTVGVYTLTYSASDAVGNVGRATRTVRVTDQTPPVITLNGLSVVQIPYGSSYSDPGAMATDAVDGDLSAYVQVIAPMQTPSAGSSLVRSYVVSDFSGNESETLVRTLEIVKATPSITAAPTASAITVGQALSSSTLTGGSASVPGSFAWTTPGTLPPEGTSSYSVTFTPTDTANYNTVTTTVSVTVNPAQTPIESWADGFGLSGSGASSSADPDGDGWSNAQEYAFGLNPTNRGGSLASLTQSTNQVKLTFLQKDTGGITYAVKAATSLVGGFTNSITPQLSADTNGVPAGYKRYEATLPTSTGRGFLKVEATIP